MTAAEAREAFNNPPERLTKGSIVTFLPAKT
jgi:hypothetical protein